jgi:ubiquinone/menaquinone biosynthesis C-methylase UbiE
MVQNQYKQHGAYHWDWFNGAKKTYQRHVSFLKRWVKEKNTIDIGAGDGVITHELTIRGVDNDNNAIKLAAEKGVKIDFGNASFLPYKNEQFESALMSDTLEHLGDITRPLKEARRVITKYLYISLPITRRFAEPGHKNYWTPYELVANVEKSGFKLAEQPRKKADRLHYYFKFKKVA